MSFRWFIYYCALFGACAGHVGWALAQVRVTENALGQACVRGLLLGTLLALVLTVIDGVWAQHNQGVTGGVRIIVGGLMGGLGGFVGAALGQLLYRRTQAEAVLVLGWCVAGTLVGAAPGTFDFLAGLLRNESNLGALRKLRNGALGGAVGGFLGGGLFLMLPAGWALLLRGGTEGLWGPSASGFVAFGTSVGLLIGLAQVLLKDAWVRVEAGAGAGREVILTRAETTIGQGEGCDIRLRVRLGVERTHARILYVDGRYLVEDAGTVGGTYLNGERIDHAFPLSTGDQVRLGRSVLRFGERRARNE